MTIKEIKRRCKIGYTLYFSFDRVYKTSLENLRANASDYELSDECTYRIDSDSLIFGENGNGMNFVIIFDENKNWVGCFKVQPTAKEQMMMDGYCGADEDDDYECFFDE